jgi:two-component system, cell cycle sensor histidine kinase and response regulator CckA
LSFLLKTVLGVAVIEAVLLLLLVIGSNSALASSLDRELAKRAESTLALISVTIKDAILSSDLATLSSFARDTVLLSDIAYLRIRSPNGAILAQASIPNIELPHVDDSPVELSDLESVRSSSMVMEVEGIPYGTLEMGLSTSAAVHAANSLRNRNFVIALSEMVLVALFSFLLGRYLTGQLKKLDQATAAITAGDLGLQIPVRGQDELSRTIRSFNKMSVELQASQREQAAGEARLEALLSGMTNGVALLSHDLHVRYLNPRGEALLEYLSPGWQEDGQILQLSTLNLKGGIANRSIDQTLEVMVRGAVRFFSVHLSRVRGAAEHESDWILTLSDVTAARSRDEHNRRRERLAVVGRLAAGIAHDFNNILGVIIGLAELNLSRSDGIDDELRIDLETILEQGQRSSGLVRQILDFSRSDEGAAPAIEVHQALLSTVNMLCRTIPSSVKLSFRPEEDSKLFALFDAAKLEQVIANLVINAVDAMPQGGCVTLTAALKEGVMIRPGAADDISERWIRIDVTDSGEGIPRSNLVDVFEPFFTTKAQSKGTGLGLAQVYGIVQQQGGDISVESQLGAGTTFSLFLRPAIKPSFKVSRTPRQITHTAKAQSNHELILVVEDEAALRQTMRAMLEELGYRVMSASTGKEGLDAYVKQQSDIRLILTDAVMPIMGGIELVKALRGEGCLIPIVMMSGYFQHEGVDLRALGKDLDAFLEKPVSIDKLADTIGAVLAGHHGRGEG